MRVGVTSIRCSLVRIFSSFSPVSFFSSAARENYSLMGSTTSAVPVTCKLSSLPNSYEGSKTARHTLRFSLSARNLSPPSETNQNYPSR